MEEVPLKEGRRIEECMVLGLFLTNYAVFVFLCVHCVGPRVRVAEEACWVNVNNCANYKAIVDFVYRLCCSRLSTSDFQAWM